MNAKDQAYLLLGILAEFTHVEGEPRIVTDFQDRTGLTPEEMGAAWRYLKDLELIDTFRIPLTARINPRGISAIQQVETERNSGPGTAVSKQVSTDSLSALTQRQRGLLDSLMRDFVATPSGVDALKFRADHDGQLPDIDALIEKRFVDRFGDKFLVRLPTLAAFGQPGSLAEPLWFLSCHVFTHLRALYKGNPKASIQLADLCEAADMPIAQIRKALEVLTQAPIWGQLPMNLSDGAATIAVAEQILEYQDLPAVLKWFVQQQAHTPSVKATVRVFTIDREGPAKKVSHAVILVHGIRTQAEWQQRVASILENGQMDVHPTRYGFLDVLRFLVPIDAIRMRPVKRVERLIRDVKSMRRYTRISIICHSFGTWILAKILERETDITFHRIVLCGSVIPDTFEWNRYRAQFGEVDEPGYVVNDCGMKDIWPVLANSATWGYGSSGRFGFGDPRVKDRFHDVGHSGYFSSDFVAKYWLPFLAYGEAVPGVLDRPTTSWWVSILTILKIKYLLVVAVITTCVWLTGGLRLTGKLWPHNDPLDLRPTVLLTYSVVTKDGVVCHNGRIEKRGMGGGWVELIPSDLNCKPWVVSYEELGQDDNWYYAWDNARHLTARFPKTSGEVNWLPRKIYPYEAVTKKWNVSETVTRVN